MRIPLMSRPDEDKALGEFRDLGKGISEQAIAYLQRGNLEEALRLVGIQLEVLGRTISAITLVTGDIRGAVDSIATDLESGVRRTHARAALLASTPSPQEFKN